MFIITCIGPNGENIVEEVRTEQEARQTVANMQNNRCSNINVQQGRDMTGPSGFFSPPFVKI